MRPMPDFRWLLEEDLRESLIDLLTEPGDALRARLAELEAQAPGAGPSAATFRAVALGALGRTEEAIAVLRAVLADHPRYFIARVDLARCYFDAGQFHRAEQELETALKHAGEARARERGAIAQALRSLVEWRRDKAGQAAELRDRAGPLRERLARGEAEPGDARRLGDTLLELATEHDSATLLPEAVAVLDRAVADDADDTAALELLARALLRTGDRDHLGATLIRLEAVAPHSPLLSQIRTAVRAEPDTTPEGPRMVRLAQDAARSGPQGDAALADLRELVRAAPRDLNLRSTLMLALSARGQHAEAVELADGLTADSDSHTSHFNVVQIYLDSGDEERAHQHLQRAWELAADESERQDVLMLVDFLNARGAPSAAGAPETGDAPDPGPPPSPPDDDRAEDQEELRNALAERGESELADGLVDAAVATFKQALDLPIAVSETGMLSRATKGWRWARSLRGLGRSGDAREILDASDLVLTDLGMLADLPSVWDLAIQRENLRGLLVEDDGDFYAGQAAYRNARILAERQGSDLQVFEAWSNEAGSLGKAGQLRAAVRENRRILEWTADRPGLRPAALNNLAYALRDVGGREEATRCYRQGIAILNAAGVRNTSLALAWFGLGDIATDEAEKTAAYRHALDVAESGGGPPSGMVLVMLLDRLKHLPGRDDLLASAAAADHWLITLTGALARVEQLIAAGDAEAARDSLRDLRRRYPTAVMARRIRWLLAETLIDGTAADRQEAFDTLWPPAEERDRDILIDLLCQDAPPATLPDDRSAHELAFDLLEAAKAENLLPGLAMGELPVPATVPAELANRETGLLAERRAVLRSDDRLAPARLRRLDEALAEVWSRIEAYDADYVRRRRGEPITVRDLCRELAADPDTTLVSFWAGKDSTIAFVCTPRTGRLSVTRCAVGRAELEQAARRLDRTFNGTPDEFPPLPPLPARRPWKRDLTFLDDLGPRLLTFLAEVPAGDHLVVSPHRALHALPLAALPAGGAPLITRHAVTLLTAASTIGYVRARAYESLSDVAFCAAVAARDDVDAAAVESDAELFTTLGLPVDEVHGLAATPAAISAGLRSRRIAHVTCHGFYDPRRPAESGLLLSDGRGRPARDPSRMSLPERLGHLLTVGEMADRGVDVRLITLRACSTNRYDQTEQSTSLANALLVAGAGSVVAALWNVDRTSSARLLRAFYRRLTDEPDRPAWHSLWMSQREMLDTGGDRHWETHPYHWAAFALVGDWR
jgi:tetratricopeptide (TPR) repeat protein